MTRDEKLKLIYRHTHRDYKGRLDGKPAILIMRNGGTASVAVADLTDAEIADKLPYVLKMEAKRRAGA